jgi:hypothetical protein
MSKIEVNTVAPQCGTTLTLGESGDTVTLGTGASQSGFGRTGTVDWQTGDIKTGNFTAENGKGYFVNTTSGVITMNLPSSPSAGNIVSIKDYAFTFANNNFKVDGNGSPIGGVDGTIPVTYDTNGTSKTFVYVDGTKGWLVVNESTDTSKEANPLYVTATGGTITTVCTNFRVHTFTGPGTFTVTCAGNSSGSNTVDYLVVSGGGGAAGSQPTYTAGGGGGAGGYRESSGAASGCYTASPLGSGVSALPVSAQGYPITVDGGGAGGTGYGVRGSNGGNTTFSTITSTGGGGGGIYPCLSGNPGGSGGGGGGFNTIPGGNGNTPPVSPPQGNNGGNGRGPQSNCSAGGGGGGATTAGANSPSGATGGVGGTGATSSINATPTVRAGGGGGGGGSTGGAGGPGGGGGGVTFSSAPGGAGTANTGGGGGGVGGDGSSPSNVKTGGAGGSGIVIIRYKFQN